jgi:hypothetical protein
MAAKIGRYWCNSRQTPAGKLNKNAAFDPTATLAVHRNSAFRWVGRMRDGRLEQRTSVRNAFWNYCGRDSACQIIKARAFFQIDRHLENGGSTNWASGGHLEIGHVE